MKKLFENIKSGLIVGITAFIVIVLGGIIYASWTSPTNLKANPGNALTSDLWNKTQDNIEYIFGSIVPSGLVASFYLENCPNGWKAADGMESPLDLRGKFVRGLNDFGGAGGKLITGSGDLDGASRMLGDFQSDAIRNMTGSFMRIRSAEDNFAGITNGFRTYGIFKSVSSTNLHGFTNPDNYVQNPVWSGDNLDSWVKNNVTETEFNASHVVPTGADNRPKNIALIYCIKE